MDGVNVGMHLGVLDHSILLQAQGVTKVKTTNHFDERFAQLEVQMSKLAEKAKAPKSEEPKKKKWVLSESEFEVYKEWSKFKLRKGRRFRRQERKGASIEAPVAVATPSCGTSGSVRDHAWVLCVFSCVCCACKRSETEWKNRTSVAF